jgi:ABC-type multidrug transport system fused ATPase/permease subunit
VNLSLLARNLKRIEFSPPYKRQCLVLFFAALPIGVLLGGTEILFGNALVDFLNQWGEVTSAKLSPFGFSIYLNPLVWTCLSGLLRCLLVFFSALLPSMLLETFNAAVRHEIALQLSSNSHEKRHISVSTVTHIASNLLPRAGVYFLSLFQLVSNFLCLCVTFGALFYISPRLAEISCIGFLIFLLPNWITARVLKSYSKACFLIFDSFFKRLVKDYRNQDFLRILGQTKTEADILAAKNRTVISKVRRHLVLINVNAIWPQLAGIAIVLYLITVNHSKGYLAIPKFLFFVYLLSRVVSSTMALTSSIGILQFNGSFLWDLVQLLWDENGVKEDLSLRKISRQFDGSIHQIQAEALEIGRDCRLLENPISFTANAGEMLIIFGPSGLGKTTLLMTIIGVVPKLRGRVFVNGMDIDQIPPEVIRARVAYSGSDPFLLDLTVRENLFLGCESAVPTEDQIAEVFRITDCEFVYSLPNQLEYRLKEGGSGLSAGERQRLSLARALLRNHEILILDEALSSLSEDAEHKIIRNIRTWQDSKIILAVSHRPSFKRYADRVICLDSKKLDEPSFLQTAAVL